MRRSLLWVLALSSSFLFGADSRAVQITINVSGDGNWDYVSSLVPNPPGTILFGAGSSLTIETDTNQDGVIGDVTLVGGTLKIVGSLSLGAYGSFSFDMEGSESGATGSLSGNQILWATPASIQTSPAGTFECGGAVCGLMGRTQGTVYPISVFFGFNASDGGTLLSSAPLGTWKMSGPLDQILGSSRQTIALGGATPPPGQGLPSEWYAFGRQDLGFVPEPGASALLALGMAALWLRSHRLNRPDLPEAPLLEGMGPWDARAGSRRR